VPELPEVETVVRSIAPHIVGRTIERADLRSHRVTRQDRAQTATALTGAKIRAVRRHGKQILVDLDRGFLYIHLGMTGKLLWNADPGKYTRAYLQLDRGALVYDDVRQFGRVEFFPAIPTMLERVGPDALQVTFQEFFERLKQRRVTIKALLLNQAFVGGVGNIYADEALFAAGIHPRALTGRISEVRARRLHASILEVLEAAIQHRGSSISDYVDGGGNPGGYQKMHNVYGRAGDPCPRCGTAIRRTVVAQRGTHYCPRCQRA
jgi:formamidopyrimidine-DNA glycosylase